MVVLLFALLFAAACSTLALHETFVASGETGEATSGSTGRASTPPADSAQDTPVRLFMESAPEGFELVAGEPVVQAGYGHRILGRIDLTLAQGACDPGETHKLSREAVLGKLRRRAQQEAGDAVIFIETRAQDVWMSDCDRLDRIGQEQARQAPWATGWVVRMGDTHPDVPTSPLGAAIVLPAEPGHASSADAGAPTALDAGLTDAVAPSPSRASVD